MKKITDSSSPKKFDVHAFILQLLPFLFIAAMIVLGFVSYSVWQKIGEPTDTVDKNSPNYMSDEEKNELATKVTNLYSSESVPVSVSEDASVSKLDDANAVGVPTGYLLINGKRFSSSTASNQIHSLDVSSSTSVPVSYVPKYITSAMSEFDSSSNPRDLYFLTSSEYTQKNESDGVGIHRLDTTTGELKPFASAGGKFERALSWSEKAGLLAFNRFKNDQRTLIDLLPLENWEVVLFNPETDTIVATIDGGYQPKWSPDGTKVVYLKTSGLFMYDVATKEEKQVVAVPESGKVIATSMMDLSDDGKYLAWTTAKAGVITLFEIASWEESTLSEFGRIEVKDTEFYWPQFSPDGNFYAVQAIDKLAGNDFVRKNARLEIRPTRGVAVVSSFSLEPFFFDALFTDDWVAKLP